MTLPVSAFHAAKSRKDGLQNWCKECFTTIRPTRRAYEAAYVRRDDVKARARERQRLRPRDRKKNIMYRCLYGVGLPEVRGMWAAQDKRCASCRDEIPEPPNHNSHLDHCHCTGRVRGVLCRGCNRALGMLGESPARIR